MSDLDLIAVGRVNLDLYADRPDVQFVDVQRWEAMVGGSPTNVAVAGSRLGLRTAVFTAVGADLVGDWVMRSLRHEGVETRFVARKEGPHTSLALRAQVAPDHPLAFYRSDPADIHLTVPEADELPIDRTRALLISADAFARGSTPEACWSLFARRPATTVTILDLDLREVNWADLDAYSATVSKAVDHVDAVVGTEAEFASLLRLGSSAGEEGIVPAVRERFQASTGQVIVVKKGERGAIALVDGRAVQAQTYRIAEACSIGAGDSFAAGLIHARLAGADWAKACDFASACAAVTASRPACSSGFPDRGEVESFLADCVPIAGFDR